MNHSSQSSFWCDLTSNQKQQLKPYGWAKLQSISLKIPSHLSELTPDNNEILEETSPLNETELMHMMNIQHENFQPGAIVEVSF